jgi:hypothetical protein
MNGTLITPPGDPIVPAADSAVNLTTSHVVGQKGDTHSGDSIYARLVELYNSNQSERKVYPSLAAGATVVSANTNWVFGSYATVVPASTISNDFHVLGLSIESCNRDAVFQLELYKGAGDDLITAVKFAVVGGFFGNQVYVVGSGHVNANDRIRARLASSNGTALIATITMSIVYWEHA